MAILPNFSRRFPPAIIAHLKRRSGERTKPAASGTERSSSWADAILIPAADRLYTADSVFQIAAHEKVVPETLTLGVGLPGRFWGSHGVAELLPAPS